MAPKKQKTYLEEFTGHKAPLKVEKLLSLLKNNIDWPDWKKFKVALICIVDGILTVRSENTCYVSSFTSEMSQDEGFFLEYPWGRESFNLTMKRIVRDKGSGDGEYTVTKQKQRSLSLPGFPLSIQLVAYDAISSFDPIREDPEAVVDYTQSATRSSMKNNDISDEDVRKCKVDDDVHVVPPSDTSADPDPE